LPITQKEDYLQEKNGVVIAQTPRHTDPQALANMYLFEHHKTNLNKAHWLDTNDTVTWYTIESTYTTKKFRKKEPFEERTWIHGINLLTFKMLNGVYPDTTTIKKMVLNNFDQKHNDLMLWNMIIQGDTLKLIDYNHRDINPNTSMRFNMQLLELTPEKIIRLFKVRRWEWLQRQKTINKIDQK
jgi:hypothetical protein